MKKTRRSRDPYAALKPEMHPRTRREYIDQDYINKLSDKDKAYLAKFTDEYYGASFTPKGKSRKKDLQRTNKLRKERRDANNHRNIDVISLGKAVYPEQAIPESKNVNQEDVIIELLDVHQAANNARFSKSSKNTKNNKQS